MSNALDAAPDLLTAGRRRSWALAAPLGLALLVVLVVVPGWMSARCQCRYTPVLFAERAGLERTVLPVEVDRDARAAFASAMTRAGVFVDPDWELGLTAGGPVVYLEASRGPSIQALAARVDAMRHGGRASAHLPPVPNR